MSDEQSIGFIPFAKNEPYPQQRSLMNEIYRCLDQGSVGILESPTGTGKSLSLICAALHWQRNFENRLIEEAQKEESKSTNDSQKKSSVEVDWLQAIIDKKPSVSSESKDRVSRQSLEKFQNFKSKLEKIRNNPTAQLKSSKIEIRNMEKSNSTNSSDENDDFVLPQYESDTGDNSDSEKSDSEQDDEHSIIAKLPKIIYCSRTHSQLSQFVNEIKSTQYADIRCITLGSRSNFCINEDVNTMKSDARLTEYCLEMQRKSRTKSASGDSTTKRVRTSKSTLTSCKFKNKSLETEFADIALSKVRDIEDLITVSRTMEVCPYYGSRRSISSAQVICVPYNMVLQSELRESIGLSLQGNVIVFDEAHNLVDIINQMYSSEISLSQVETAKDALDAYLKQFRLTLSGKNLYYVSLFDSVLQKIMRLFKTSDGPLSAHFGQLVNINDILFASKLDNINLFKLKRYLTNSNFVNRIGGFSDHRRFVLQQSQQSQQTKGCDSKCIGGHCSTPTESSSDPSTPYISAVASIRSIVNFISSLMTSSSDGRVFVNISRPVVSSELSQTGNPDTVTGGGNSNGSLQFVLLNPSVHFQPIVEQARSVVLLGGTMRPFPYISSSLLGMRSSSIKPLRTFSCDHIIDPSRVAAFVVSSGPRGNVLEFKHDSRQSSVVLSELAESLVSIRRRVAKGLIVFFGSYQYMDAVVRYLKSTAASTALTALTQKQPLLTEPRNASEVETLLTSYANSVRFSGATLFCVMGGKMSEGINFRDDLARCVVVVGMPYPDPRDPVLQERIRFAEERKKTKSMSIDINQSNNDSNNNNNIGTAGHHYRPDDDETKVSSKDIYESMCMRQVNQSIGRSIRHIHDYAATILLDRRYSQPRVIQQLPQWIARRVTVCSRFDEALSGLEVFLDNMNKSK